MKTHPGIDAPEGPPYQELIALTDELSAEFATLNGLIRDIPVAGTPSLALVQARCALELMVRITYEKRFREPADKRELSEMIDVLLKKQQIPWPIAIDANYLRSMGNLGAHPPKLDDAAGHQAPSAEQVGVAVGTLIRVLRWYIEAWRSGVLDGPPSVARDARPAKPVLADASLAIVPKGLDSFDAGDSQFFLRLLPGPFHADNLPESIHFWKHRIEKEVTFTVGVIYGRSGCGKSSLLKAGLLPRLAESVKWIYLEASPDTTEASLVGALRRKLPKLPEGLDLRQSIETLCGRTGEGKARSLLERSQKVFIVLDQFEQWLHARRGEKDTELAQALRQCESDKVQVLLSVRDDFLSVATEFMKDLQLEIEGNKNCRLVDLFEQDHARQVLAVFGRAYGKLPDEPTPEQARFLDLAIAGLSQDHRVICVRLALFAQMFRGKAWTPKSLEEVGGTEGVGATFLEETFSASTADRKYSDHKDAAIAVLKALLPDEGDEIKGRKRSYDELLEASTYRNRQDSFAQLIRSLDSDLRLISPASDDSLGSDPSTSDIAARSYQLTHDYLVPSLRKWLQRKLQETRRGRATMLLERRTSFWKAKKEDRHMPTIREYVVIRALTNPKEWNEDERRMMRHARNVHAKHAVIAALILPILILGAVHFWGRQHARALVETLTSARIEQVPDAIEQLVPYRFWARPWLQAAMETESSTGDDIEQAARERLHASLALLKFDPAQADYLLERLYDTKDMRTFLTVRERLVPHRERLLAPLWKTLENESEPPVKRFRAACALAGFIKDDGSPAASRWAKRSESVASSMITAIVERPEDYDAVVTALEPARRHLIAPLSAAYRNQDSRQSHQELRTDIRARYAADILARYAVDQPETIAGTLVEARDRESHKKLFASLTTKGRRPADLLGRWIVQSPSARPVASGSSHVTLKPPAPALVELDALRKANAAVALLMMGHDDGVWTLLEASAEPRVRSRLIDRLGALEVNPGLVFDRLAWETDDGIKQALILALGTMRKQSPGQFTQKLGPSKSRALLGRLEAFYREAADPGVRGAAEWVLRAWGRGDRLAEIDRSLKGTDPAPGRSAGSRRWYVNGQGQTMVVIPHAGSFQVGTRKLDPGDFTGKKEPLRVVTIDYPYAISAHEVTFHEFQQFRPEHKSTAHFHEFDGKPDRRCPVNNVSWYDAAAYCNWLSEQEGLPEDQWCYLPHPTFKFGRGMQLAEDHLLRTGYRLATEFEWEYACRAGTVTTRYYGEADDLLEEYAWFNENSGKKEDNDWKELWPVGSLMPNQLGLFDMLGNALEWCQDAHAVSALAAGDNARTIHDTDVRVMRGEKSLSMKGNLRAFQRETGKFAAKTDFIFGIRLARTLRP